ncbi:hypothetical protein [Streptomyces sp. 8L]|uniref:hypothetical protein n=1 Tax=Streptomyces sp. 8L TaxID=2877242 RepID=UPI001CD50564|nr:hypothetical protein [Streptomyces sp. 8L]MCA1223741.1 hypothetical protein [Streptomyces sp. 8L]
MTEAQIILSASQDSGIAAIPSGEHYPRAHTALAESGFQRDADFVYHMPANGNKTTLADLITCAKRHRVSVHTSSRRFIGDAARDLARLLPGQWKASVEVYSHPAWQEHLVPWIWDSGELGRALKNERIPYAGTLTDTVNGTTLLYVERPGHQLHYLVGALASDELQEGYGDPHAPRSIVLPPSAGRAAQAIADQYLPAYERTVHSRRTSAIATALRSIRSEYDTWQATVSADRHGDATPLGAAVLSSAAERFLSHSWRHFLTVLDHAPPLIDHCRPAGSPWPDDAATLSRLTDAVTLVQALHDSPLSSKESYARAWPAIETWLTDGEIFLRQARVSAPHHRPALPVATPVSPLPTGRPRHGSH